MGVSLSRIQATAVHAYLVSLRRLVFDVVEERVQG